MTDFLRRLFESQYQRTSRPTSAPAPEGCDDAHRFSERRSSAKCDPAKSLAVEAEHAACAQMLRLFGGFRLQARHSMFIGIVRACHTDCARHQWSMHPILHS